MGGGKSKIFSRISSCGVWPSLKKNFGTRFMTYKEQIFISIGYVTFESLPSFEKIYLHKSRNIHGFLMEIERKSTTL